MGLEDAIKSAIGWIRKEPAVLLPGLLNWIPPLIFSLLIIQLAPGVQAILAENPQNPIAALLAHSAELVALFLSALGIIILLSLVGFVIQGTVALGLAACAAQLKAGKELKIGEALSVAWSRLGRYLAAQLLLIIALLAAMLVVVLIGIALVISVVGIILLVLLIIPAAIAFVLTLIAASAIMFFLPAVVLYGNPTGAWDGVKKSWDFVNTHRLGSAVLVVLVMATNAVLNSIAQAAGLFGGSILGLFVQLVIGTLATLVATAYWMDEDSKSKA